MPNSGSNVVGFRLARGAVQQDSTGEQAAPDRPPPDSKRKAEQPGAAQPATQPADKLSVKDQPSPPTSKDSPR